MILFSTVFKMKELKRIFYNFFGALVVLVLVCFTMVGLIEQPDPGIIMGFNSSWILYFLLFAVSFLQGQISKVHLKKVRKYSDPEGLFNQYTLFYKKRLVMNFVAVLITAALYVLTFFNAFFYVLIVQLVFAFAFYPRKQQIQKDLPGREIIFS